MAELRVREIHVKDIRFHVPVANPHKLGNDGRVGETTPRIYPTKETPLRVFEDNNWVYLAGTRQVVKVGHGNIAYMLQDGLELKHLEESARRYQEEKGKGK